MASNKFDINTARSVDLAKLAGVGKNKAQAIVKYRKGKGPFKAVQDLQEVPGIGPSIIDSNRQLLTCHPPKKRRRPQQCTCFLFTPHSARVTRSQAAVVAARTSIVATPVASGSGQRPRTRSSLRAAGLGREGEGEGLGEEHRRGGYDPVPPITSGCPIHGDQDGIHTQDDMDLLNDDDSKSPDLAPERDDAENDETEDEEDADDEDDSEEEEEEEGGEEAGVWEEGKMDWPQDVSAPSRSSPSLRNSHPPQLSQGQRKRGRDSLQLPGEKRPCRMFPQDGQSSKSGSSPSSGGSRKLTPRPQPSPLSSLRNRIPSKDHPPPGLAAWLSTFKVWSNAERLMAIDELIALCRPTQVRHMMAVIEPQFQRDFISLLPKELALYVLSFLEPKDLLRAAQTCRYWRLLAEDNLLWREKCREENIEMTRRRDRLWKNAYMRQYSIELNWRSGAIRTPKALKGHDDHVITCLEFCGNRIVSGSDDNTLKVWSVVSGKCLRTLVGHTGGVWSSQMSGTTVISGSTDRTLKVWNSETGQCRHTLYGHTSTVRCMSLHKNKVVSGSRDATLRVWDIETGHCLHVLQGHVAAVRCVQYDGRRVVSGAYDYTVRVWDPETETCLHTLQGHTNRVYSLQFDGVHVVSGSLDTSIKVWDVEAGSLLHTLIGHQSLTSGLELQDNILVSGNADSTVKVWDITTGQCLQTLQGLNKHQSAVTCLQFSKKFVITSSDDGTVKIWDLKTGEFLRNLVALDSGGSGGVVWRLRCSNTKLVCAVGSRNGTEETKLLVLDFDVDDRRASS